MTGGVSELLRILDVARTYLGRELTDEETRVLIAWYETEMRRSSGGAARGQPPGLSAATSVLTDGRAAAEQAMLAALNAARQSEAQALSPARPPGPKSLASQEERILKALLESHIAKTDQGLSPAQFAELARLLTEIIQVETERQVELRMVAADNRINLRLTEISNAAIEITNALSADIREQLARELAAQARRETQGLLKGQGDALGAARKTKEPPSQPS